MQRRCQISLALTSRSAVSVLQDLAAEDYVKNPSQPDTQADEYLPEAPNAHKDRTSPADHTGVNPRDPSSMPRAEDDAKTQADSPEFHDRTDVPEGGSGSTIAPPNIE
jgi:hypothetical protein